MFLHQDGQNEKLRTKQGNAIRQYPLFILLELEIKAGSLSSFGLYDTTIEARMNNYILINARWICLWLDIFSPLLFDGESIVFSCNVILLVLPWLREYLIGKLYPKGNTCIAIGVREKRLFGTQSKKQSIIPSILLVGWMLGWYCFAEPRFWPNV